MQKKLFAKLGRINIGVIVHLLKLVKYFAAVIIVNNPLGNLNSGRKPGERSSLQA